MVCQALIELFEHIQEKNADNTPLKEITELKSASNISNGSGRNLPDTSLLSISE